MILFIILICLSRSPILKVGFNRKAVCCNVLRFDQESIIFLVDQLPKREKTSIEKHEAGH